MAKQDKMTDEELISLIDQHVTDALGYDDAISTQREKAMEYYYGLPFGNEVEGRSQFVDQQYKTRFRINQPSAKHSSDFNREEVCFCCMCQRPLNKYQHLYSLP